MPEPGVWFIRPVSVISNNEKWMHTPALKKDLSTALDWEKKLQLEPLIFLDYK
ncbi:MAG: hypothetical protein K9J38_12695 [Polynucleobacter sp.]|nr:hypothetical protein [Polynucleobacter sp.]